MKKLLRQVGTLLLYAISLTLSSQTIPQGISYQAVALDPNGHPVIGVDPTGQPIENAEINVRIAVLDGTPTGPVLYEEQHTVLTDQYGLFTLTIGEGLVASGAFNAIDWASDKKYLQTKLDLQRTGNFILAGVQQLMSVPYAFVAQSAIDKDDADSDPSNELQTLSRSNDTLYLTNGGAVVLPLDSDRDPENELQHLFVLNDSLYLSNDSIGMGIPYSSNGRQEQEILFNTKCFPLDIIDSIPYRSGGIHRETFVQTTGHSVLVSPYKSEWTLVLDSLGNRLTTLGISLQFAESGVAPVFENHLIHRPSNSFTGLRFENMDGDTIGSTVITSEAYLLFLDNFGNYIHHVSLDTLFLSGCTNLRISAISNNYYFLQFNRNNQLITKIYDSNLGTITSSPLLSNSIPQYVQSREYWIERSSQSDSCLAFYTLNGSIKQFKYFSDTSEIKYLLFNILLENYNYSNLDLKSLPNSSISAVFGYPGEEFMSKNTGLSVLDSTFTLVDLPYFFGTNGASRFILNPCILIISNDTIFYYLIAAFDLYNWSAKGISYQNSDFIISNLSNFDYRFYYHIGSKKFGKLINQNTDGNALLQYLNASYAVNGYFLKMDNLVFGLTPSKSKCHEFAPTLSQKLFYLIFSGREFNKHYNW
jgi:hypothetical protein